MRTFRLEKIPGGARIQIDSGKFHGIHPNELSIVDIEVTSVITFKVRGVQDRIDPAVDTVILDETAIGGATWTWGPTTRTAKQLHADFMNVLNPFSNYITT